jgi:hypothetical protein
VKSALVISVRDNVATALRALAPGQRLDLRSTLIVEEPIAPGHKDRSRRSRRASRSSNTAADWDCVARHRTRHTRPHTTAVDRGDLDVQTAGRKHGSLSRPTIHRAPAQGRKRADGRTLGSR